MESNSLNAAAEQYRRNAVMTASPEKLVLMLMEGALRFIDRARNAIEQNQVATAGESLSRAFAIVSELRSCLDKSASEEIAGNLDRLYGFILDRLVTANRRRELEPIAEARRILETIKEGWNGVCEAS